MNIWYLEIRMDINKELIYNIMKGDLDKVKELVEQHHADVNTRTDGSYTALQIAYIYRKHSDDQFSIIDYLLNHGALINARDKTGTTVLMLAVMDDEVEFVKYFLQEGADPNLRTELGLTAVDFAAMHRNEDILNLFGIKSVRNFWQEYIDRIKKEELEGPMDYSDITKIVYEAARLEAKWSGRSVVPEPWEERDEDFRDQMIEVVEDYLKMDKLPTPEEAHDSWVKAYEKMGWKYGEKRDPVLKTHPDMVPFDALPLDEQQKDAIFLAFVYVARELLRLPQFIGNGYSWHS